MSYSFSQVPTADIPRSSFNRSHGHKTTFYGGHLVPFFVDEALPGDTFNVNASLFARLATPIVPVMDNLHLDVFFFAVPNRLLWVNWQKFMGEQENPGESTDYLVPVVNAPAGGFTRHSIFDYFGVPTGVNNIACSALFPRAYSQIWNQWFRDENLQPSLATLKGDGPDNEFNYALMRRGKRHDYFTSCLPWPQKGPGVEVPIGGSAPVSITANPASAGIPLFDQASFTGANIRALYAGSGSAAVQLGTVPPAGLATQTAGANMRLGWYDPALVGVADLSSATAVTINALRQAFQIQRLLERDARGGTRYVEILRAHFGVVSPDARLQRPEYLGGGSVAVNINPVTQTSSTDATSPQGNLAAYGIAAGSGIGFSKSFVEHCVIIGLCAVRADLSYQQGLPRMFSRRTRYDFYWPALAHLGEQAVLNKEIYAQGNAADNQVFGYQERWAEYRYFPSKITGKFRSTDPQPLDVWHLAQKFTGLPTLNATFIQDIPPISRVVAVQTEPEFLFDSHLSIKCTRPMPTYSVPGLIDHF